MRLLPLISLLVCAVAALTTTPANAQLVGCNDESGKPVVTNLPCVGGRIRADAWKDAQTAYDKGDYAQAIRIWRSMAEKGNAVAQSNMGLVYYQGRGVAKDDQEAAKWWRLAVAQGDAQAQNNLNALYQEEQARRDLLAAPAPTSQTPPQVAASQPGLDLLATPAGLVASQPALDPYAPPQAASHPASYLDRVVKGAITGAVVGALVGLFILVRALINRFKAPVAAGATAIYRARPQGVTIGAALLLGCVALLAYLLFFRTNTVDDYLNDYQGRLEKLQECGQVPDMTKDRECMNAYTAQRMFMSR